MCDMKRKENTQKKEMCMCDIKKRKKEKNTKNTKKTQKKSLTPPMLVHSPDGKGG
jgi:hypothetical protein